MWCSDAVLSCQLTFEHVNMHDTHYTTLMIWFDSHRCIRVMSCCSGPTILGCVENSISAPIVAAAPFDVKSQRNYCLVCHMEDQKDQSGCPILTEFVLYSCYQLMFMWCSDAVLSVDFRVCKHARYTLHYGNDLVQ